MQSILNSSPLSHIVGFNLVDDIPVDYMHVGPEGVDKTNDELLVLKKSNRTKAYYLRSKLK